MKKEHKVGKWIVKFLSNGKIYVRNEEWTKEAYFTFENIAGVILLKTYDNVKIPKYVQNYIKKLIGQLS